MPQGLLGSGVFSYAYVLREIGQRGFIHTCPGSMRFVRPGRGTETRTKAAVREATGSTCFQWTLPFFRRTRVNSSGCPLHLASPSTLLLHGGTEAHCLWYPTWCTVWVGCPRPLAQGQAPDSLKRAKQFMGERVEGSLFL